MNVRASNIENLHNKLGAILQKMNTKYILDGGVDVLYTPQNNSKLIFEVYLHFLPFHVKTLLLQNNINNMENAFTYYLQNNMLHEIDITCTSLKVDTHEKNAKSNHDFPSNSKGLYHKTNVNESGKDNTNLHKQHSGTFRNRNPNFNFNPNYNNSNIYHRNVENNHSGNFNGSGRYDRNMGRWNARGGPNGHGNSRNYSGRFSNNSRHHRQQPVVPMEVDNLENFQLSPHRPTYP